MKKGHIVWATFLVLLLSLSLLGSCAKRMKKEPAALPEEAIPAPAVESKPSEIPEDVKETWTVSPGKEEVPEVISIDELNRQKILMTVYFDFDKYDLRSDTIATLKENSRWLQEHSQYKILLEGHCDERGTIEYNLELGAKRANAVRNYLLNLGLNAVRFKIISYGEERPADPGHGEEAWAKNRRVEFVIEE
ncbi:MAG: peptidoglycan-associated lipoprotein Pal [Acidobacteriota bacterium]